MLRLTHPLSAGFAALLLLAPASSVFAQEHLASPERHAARMPQDLFVPARQGWVTYVNARSGASLTYPADLFEPLPPSEGGESRRFISRDGEAELEFIVLPRAPGQTPGSLQQSLMGQAGYGEVTYSPRGRSWFVLSGYREGRVFYDKYVFTSDNVQAFALAYPTSHRHVYDSVVEAIEDNFRPSP